MRSGRASTAWTTVSRPPGGWSATPPSRRSPAGSSIRPARRGHRTRPTTPAFAPSSGTAACSSPGRPNRPGFPRDPDFPGGRACYGTWGTGGRSGPCLAGSWSAGSAAALAAERALLAGRAVRTVDLPGVLAPAPAAGVGLLGALAFQRLAELAHRLVLGARSVAGAHLAPRAGPVPGTRLALGALRLRRRVSHVGLLPPADTPSLAHPAAPGRGPFGVPHWCPAAAGSGIRTG